MIDCGFGRVFCVFFFFFVLCTSDILYFTLFSEANLQLD